MAAVVKSMRACVHEWAAGPYALAIFHYALRTSMYLPALANVLDLCGVPLRFVRH